MNSLVRLIGVLLLSMAAVTGMMAQDSTETTVAVGDSILLQGRVLDVQGEPLAGAVVEIWQTDATGSYNHPQDPNSDSLDPDFQYFGTSTTDEDGYYAFRTIVPGEYDPRPAHIHVKVKAEDGAELLTTQFYFNADDEAFGESADPLMLMFETIEAEDEDSVLVASFDLVIDRDSSANDDTLTPTLSQAEGPFYPVEDLAAFDNDLTSTAADDEIVVPLLAEDMLDEAVAAEELSGRALYRITPENSEVNFVLQEDLRGIRTTVVGVTDQVAGDIIIDFGTPQFSQIGMMRINARTFSTNNEFRDRALRAEILRTREDQYEFIDFAPTALNNLPEAVVVGGTYTFEIVGNLTITGVTNEVTFEADVTIDDPNQISGIASTTVLWGDWNITIPSAPGVANITEDVTLSIDFVANQVEQ